METRKSLFLKTMIAIAIIFFINISFFIFMFGLPSGNISGLSITETLSEAYSKVPTASKVFFISAWVIFILLIAGVFIRDRYFLKKKSAILNLNLSYGKFQTDLDVLYNVLKDRKKIKIKTISESFRVNPNQAMYWAKILESGRLASIEYPGLFGDPELVIR